MTYRAPLNTRAGQRLRERRFRVPCVLPGQDGEPVTHRCEELVGEGPAAMEGPAGRRFRWETGDENRDPSWAEIAPVELADVDLVVAEQVGLDRVAMVS